VQSAFDACIGVPEGGGCSVVCMPGGLSVVGGSKEELLGDC